MASSHGAGLMLIPDLYHGDHMIHHLEHFGLFALAVHAIAMLLTSNISIRCLQINRT